MSAIDSLFQQLRMQQRKALMPFLTAGDPDLDFTCQVISELARHGCHLCELGIPYSDPVADGPVIQASYARAIEHGVKLEKIFAAIAPVATNLNMPLVNMVSYAIIYRRGLERYVEQAQQAGVAGAIVPDLPWEESRRLADICRKADFSLIQLVTPTTAPDRAVRIADLATGFIYYVSVTGITGERTELPVEIATNVAELRERIALPICIGFGISKPEHVRMLAPVADGLIVGSAIVRRMAQAATRPRNEVLTEIGSYVDSLLDALRA